MTERRDVESLLNELSDLLNEWDPIGVNPTLREDGLPLDEYRGYAPPLLSMLQRGAETDEVADHLYFLAKQQMGLPTTKPAHAKMAARIVVWFQTASTARR